MEWSEVKSSQLKAVAAGVGGLALVAMGTLTVVFSGSPGNISGAGISLTLGETTTSETGVTELATSFAVPEVTASVPEGFGNGG